MGMTHIIGQRKRMLGLTRNPFGTASLALTDTENDVTIWINLRPEEVRELRAALAEYEIERR
jgi:hypothetical protein